MGVANKFNDDFSFNFFFIELSATYDHIFGLHTQRPSCNYSDCEQRLYHQRVDHFHMFQVLLYHLYRGKIDHRNLDDRKPVFI